MKNPITISSCLFPPLIYLVIAFYEWDINLAHWIPEQRAAIGIAGILGAMWWAYLTVDNTRRRDFDKMRLERKSGPAQCRREEKREMSVITTGKEGGLFTVVVNGSDGASIVLGRFAEHETAQRIVAYISDSLLTNNISKP